MTQNNDGLREGNKLIAEFMEVATCTDPQHVDDKCYFVGRYRTSKELQYHLSWDWLMPVVEKIESLTAIGDTSGKKGAYKLYIDPWYVDFADYSEEETRRIAVLDRSWHTDLLQPIYEVVIEFIKWYNQNTQQ